MSRGELIKHQQIEAVGTYTATILDGSQQHDMLLEYAWASYVSDSSIASRQISLIVLDENGDSSFYTPGFASQAESKTYHYCWMLGEFRGTIPGDPNVDAVYQCSIPPRFLIQKGYTLKITDTNGTDAGDVVTFKGTFSVLR